MIIKKREFSGTFAGLASLIPRISETDEMFKRINSDFKSSRAGFAGELKVDNYLDELELKMPHYIIQNLNIKVGKKEVQIDTILIHPNFILVIEIKNMRGEFYFDPVNKQFYRVNDLGEKEGMRNPEAQLSRATSIINSFLHGKGFEIDSDGLIVFVSRSGIVIEASKRWKTIQLDSLVQSIELLESKSSQLISHESCKQLAFELLGKDRPDKFQFMTDYYKIPIERVKKRVRCPKCNYIPLARKHSRWLCIKCGTTSRDAHIVTLQEYRLLFGPEITSKQASDFMQHDSIYYAIRVLNKDAKTTGTKERYRFFRIADERHLLSELIQSELKK